MTNHDEREAALCAEAEHAARRYTWLTESWPPICLSELVPRPVAIADLEQERLRDQLEIVEATGSIKWFDAAKGYGFITADGDGHDVLLHVTCLRAAGFQTAYDGARVRFQVLRRPKGPQAYRILEMDDRTAIHPSQRPRRTHLIVEPESDWERALLKWINRVRGFGFLTRGDGTPDIFITMETLRRFGFAELRPGQIVQVRWGYSSNRCCMAAELRPDDASSGAAARAA